MKNEQGFSLIELLIVVAIIAIIAAIAVPNMLQARMAANETGAISSARTFGSAEVAYSATNNQKYASVADLVSGDYLDNRWSGTGDFGGYLHTPTVTTGASTFSIAVAPNQLGSTGRFGYLMTERQVVEYDGTCAPSVTTCPTINTPVG
jgi:prepilin-type N-terminal cleavage/methylation domain-containing protein